jgi:hypothetical protein
MTDRYVTLEHNDLLIQVKLEHEGVVLDVFDKENDVIKTHYKYYDDMGLTAPKEVKNEPS